MATSMVLLQLWSPSLHTQTHTHTHASPLGPRVPLPLGEWNTSWWSCSEHKRLNCRVNHFPTQIAFRMQQSGHGGKITKWALWPNNKSCHCYVFIPTCSPGSYLAWQLMIHCSTIYGLCVNSKPWKHGYFKQVKLLFNYIISRLTFIFYYRFAKLLLFKAETGTYQVIFKSLH